ncbi:hypothetical protein KTR10_00510 [Candidatus Kaiserbacteria bacterium]|nr:hypothetical protein [Candidatus Kaiserbacteria bacterium]
MTKSVLKAAAYVTIVIPSAFISSTTYALYGLEATVEVLLGLFLLVLALILCGVLEPIERWVASTRVFKRILRLHRAIFQRIR